jgi:phosphatidylinositol glycan class T
LNPHRLFDGEWTLIDVGVKRYEDEINVSLGVGSVLDPVRKDRLSGQLGRRGESLVFSQSTFGIDLTSLTWFATRAEFSFSSLYDRTLKTACPVASSSEVQLVVPTHSVNSFSIEPESVKELKHLGGRDVVVWDTKRGESSLDN